MAKKVRYNGGKDSYYRCSEPTNLIIGKVYEVVYERDRGWQTDYTLKGVEGEFNSVWFDDVVSNDKVYMAISRALPIIGERYECCKIEFLNGKPTLLGVTTSVVREISDMGNHIYKVGTINSVYIVKIG